MASDPDSLPCAHSRAEPTGTTTARQLRDGRWEYATPFRCPDCGACFTERHAQALPRPSIVSASTSVLERSLSVKDRLAAVLKFGRIRHAFAIAVPVGALIIAATTALAFFGATGSGTITGISGSSASTSTVSLTQAVPTATIVLGGNASFTVLASCLSGCPGSVGSINLQSWSSSITGCNSAAFPGSFTMPAVGSASSPVVVGATPTSIGIATITWANLGVDQSVCKNHPLVQRKSGRPVTVMGRLSFISGPTTRLNRAVQLAPRVARFF
jgi:hypothetical protein